MLPCLLSGLRSRHVNGRRIDSPGQIVDVEADEVDIRVTWVCQLGRESAGAKIRVPVECKPLTWNRAHGSDNLTEALGEIFLRRNCDPSLVWVSRTTPRNKNKADMN